MTGGGSSSGGGAGGGGGGSCWPPFTVAQWQELEHQALIFKYLKAGVQVPDALLAPIHQSLESMSARFLQYPGRKWSSPHTKKKWRRRKLLQSLLRTCLYNWFAWVNSFLFYLPLCLYYGVSVLGLCVKHSPSSEYIFHLKGGAVWVLLACIWKYNMLKLLTDFCLAFPKILAPVRFMLSFPSRGLKVDKLMMPGSRTGGR